MARLTDTEIAILLEEARDLALNVPNKAMRARAFRLAAESLRDGDGEPRTSELWQAVARNIATSHPEGAEVFTRVALAHGLNPKLGEVTRGA